MTTEVIDLPEDPRRPYRLYPGGFLGCLSAVRVTSWMHGTYVERCHEPRCHDGKHINYRDNGRREWLSSSSVEHQEGAKCAALLEGLHVLEAEAEANPDPRPLGDPLPRPLGPWPLKSPKNGGTNG